MTKFKCWPLLKATKGDNEEVVMAFKEIMDAGVE